MAASFLNMRSLLSLRPAPKARLLMALALALELLLLLVAFGMWARAGRGNVQPETVAEQPAPAPSRQGRLLELRRSNAVATDAPVAEAARNPVRAVAKTAKTIRPKFEAAPHKPALAVAVVKPAAPVKAALLAVTPPASQTIASTTPPPAMVSGPPRSAAIRARPTSGHLPRGVRVGQDGKVYLGYRPVAATFEATRQFSPKSKGPVRYIFGSHVYAESQDTMHGGEPALEQSQHYVMSDERSERAAGADGAGHAVSLVLIDRGTDAEISNASAPGSDGCADNGSPLHLVNCSSARCAPSGTLDPALGGPTEPSMIAPTPRFDLTPDSFAPFHGTAPRCHPRHQVVMQQTTDPAIYRRFTPTQREPQLDARLRVVALQYFGHSSPEEVLADLEAARANAQSQAATQDTGDAEHAMLQLCDSEVALWQDVVSSSSTADAAAAAYRAGDVQHAGVLCRDYQSQVAPYANRPEWSLFSTQSQQVDALAGRLGDQSAAAR